ncbi:MAG TPA: LLM class flavin-dependent oxidoreductase, partial [Pseudonocardiaceae bacterium]|nr:LLM class flavin-dependent oxidoreductase [Pseudonocardiaceae bacterium]
ELPVWVTASGNPATFTEAARLGTNVLTSLIGQSPEQLAENIARYRAVRAEHGHDPLAGTVTVMLHAYLETDTGSARQLCREPLREYLRGYVAQQQDMPTNGAAVPEDIETQLDFAYERYSTGAALIGSPDSVRPLLGRLAEAGVDEIACLVDFGMPLDRTLRSIRLLGGLRSGPAAEILPGAGRARRTAPMGVDQERMFRLEQVNPAGPANYVTTGLRVRGELRPDLLDAALRVVGERHEVLRTTFGQVGGEPVQLIEPEFRVRLQRHDLSDVPPPDRVRAARRLRTEVARRPFRFDEPVLRVALLRLDEAEHQLAIVQQHMITDWVSFNVFVHELFAVYGDLVRGRPTELPPAPPYRAFAERERARLRDGLLDDQLDHWIRDLRDAPEPVTLPLAGPRPAAQTFEGRREWLLLPEQTTQRLAALSRAERVTPFMTAYTALAACLARTSGQDDLVVGSPTANRDWAPEQLMGLLLRPMLLRTRLRPDQSFRSALADVRAVTSRALANAEVPYQALVDRLAPDRDLEWLPLFRLRYLFLRWDEPVTVSGLRLSPLDTDPQTSLYDATVSLWDSTRGAFGRIEYCRDIIARDTVVGTIERFATMLHSAVADPDQRLGDLPDSSPTRFHVDTDELEDYLGTQSVHS